MELATNNPITANGSYTQKVIRGKYYTCALSGSFGAGTLSFNWVDSVGNKVAFENSPLTEATGFEFIAPTDTVDLTLAGATAPSINVQIATVDNDD
jgi:hypothetical protein